MTDVASFGFGEREDAREKPAKCATRWRIAIPRLNAREKTAQCFGDGVLIVEDVSTGKAIVLLLIGGVIALAAYETGRRSAREAAAVPGQPDAGATGGVPAPREPAPPDSPPVESGATIEVPLGERVPTPAPTEVPPPPDPTAPPAPPPLPAIEERREDEPGSCLTLEATPNSVSAYGASGPAVQLVVRARNRCATAFSGPSTYFRVTAAGANGFPFATVNGRFSGSIPPFGTAETLVAITGDVTRVASYRAELR